MKSLPDPRSADIVRFWNKVQKSDNPDSCWHWTAGVNKLGYGTVHLRSDDGTCIDFLAHRFSYFLSHGALPADLCVLHKCDTPDCVNPDHLWIGTRLDNNKDRHMKNRSNGPRGDKNGTRLHPESVKHGEAAHAAKLTQLQVDQIRAQFKPFVITYKMLATSFGVHERTIQNILTRKTWQKT